MVLAGPTHHSPRDALCTKPLYQNSLKIKSQLSQISGFPDIFALQRDENKEEDPLTFLIQVFRQGITSLMLLARVQGAQDVAYLTEFQGNFENHEQNISKVATFKFIRACMDDLGEGFSSRIISSFIFRPAKNTDPDPASTLRLKGRIFVSNVIVVLSLYKPGNLHPLQTMKLLVNHSSDHTSAKSSGKEIPVSRACK